jgi:dTDP-4-amino-4,6-dideoxygalactose transaminase
MRKAGVEISSHYEPLNLSLHGKRIGVSSSACEFSKQFSQSVLRFPLYPGLDIDQADQIAREFVEIMQNRSSKNRG